MIIRTIERRQHETSGPGTATIGTCAGPGMATLAMPDATDIHAWLTEKIAELAGTDVDRIDAQEPVAFYGLDSVAAVSLSGELQDWLGRKIPPTLVYDCPSIESMVRYLSPES